MEKKKETTFKCVTVLIIIGVVCGLLLAVLYPMLYVEPSLDDMTAKFTLNSQKVESSWERVEIVKEHQSPKGFVKGAKIELVGKTTVDNESYTGFMAISSESSPIGECSYAVFIKDSTKEIVFADFIKNGATPGYEFQNNKGSFEVYYNIPISSADVFGNDLMAANTGATKSQESVHKAMQVTAYYYFNVFGGGSVES